MKKLLAGLLLIAMGCSMIYAQKNKKPLYLDSKQPIEKRVEDLLKRMTLEEKVAQMNQFVGLEHMKIAEKDMTEEEMRKSHAAGFYPGLHSSEVEKLTKKGMIGSFLHVVTYQEANYLQSLALQSRLKIPVLIGIDAIHGNGLYHGATIYPTPIGQASTFDEGLVEKASRETALEMRASGMHWTFTPNVEIARDARWGRVGETFGEDTYLVGRMGAATVRGFQAPLNNPSSNGADAAIACAKHMVGGSQPVNGINGAPFDASVRTLWEVFLPPFKECIDAGVYTFMMAHNEVDGVPCHGSKYLMTEVLRKKWGFNGFVVSDWMDVERMQDYHRITPTLKDAYYLSVDAGLDMHMHGPQFDEKVVELVREGKLSMQRIDFSASKILEAKFRLGLFENPYIDEKKVSKVVFNEKHQQTALEMARKSIVLLKNDSLLPIDKNKYKNIFVTGPNADSQSILGDWALKQPDENVSTVLKGLKKKSSGTNFVYYPFDSSLRKMKISQVQEAGKQAQKCDLAIVVVGENSMRYNWSDKTCGENSDRYDISLFGLQQQLVEEIFATGVPTVVILINGRPLSTEWIADNIPALVEAWEPGSMGGEAIAEILFGDINPEGKLPITIPRHSGQIQTYYNYKFTSKWFNYATGKSTPLYEFGYGLSYTNFDISPVMLSAKEIKDGETVQASVKVKNVGKVAGSEVVQLYIRDCYSSVVRPVKELKAYRKIFLEPGETQTVTFDILDKDLKFYDLNMNYVVESGDFEIMIGSSSRDIDLKKALLTVR